MNRYLSRFEVNDLQDMSLPGCSWVGEIPDDR